MMYKGMFKGCRAAAFGHSGKDHLITCHVNQSWSKPSRHQLGTGGNPAERSSKLGMAMVDGTFSGPFDPATCSRSSPSAADRLKRSDEVLFFTAGCAAGGGGVFFFAPGNDILSECTDSLHSSLEPLKSII
jgi:hypothetical protein